MRFRDNDLPWEKLASRLEPAFVRLNAAKIALTPSDITFISDEETRIQIRAFVRSFVEALEKDIQALQTTVSRPDKPDELFINNKAARDIAPTIKRLRTVNKKPEFAKLYRKAYSPNTSRLCTHAKREDGCTCLVPLWARQRTPLSEVLKNPPSGRYSSYSDDSSIGRDYCLALVLNEQLAPALQLHQLLKQARVAEDNHPRHSYRNVFYSALMPYLGLSLLLEMPVTWDPEAKSKPWHDYRDTAFYQTMMGAACCGEVCSSVEMSAFPHNSFFDVPDDKWPLMPWLRKAKSRVPRRLANLSFTYGRDASVGYGELPFESFVASRKGTRRRLPPGERDMDEAEARVSLRRRGLPVEIVDMIIEMAEVDEDRPWRMEVADDPLHPDNRKALEGYLDYCWRLMVCSRIAWEDADSYGTSVHHSQRLVLETLLRLGCKNERSKDDHRYECDWCASVE